MKRIHVEQSLHFTFRGKVFDFAPKTAYEVEDDVANHRFIKRYTLSCEDLTPPKAIKPEAVKVEPAKVEAPVEEVKEAEAEKPKAKRTYKRKAKKEDE